MRNPCAHKVRLRRGNSLSFWCRCNAKFRRLGEWKRHSFELYSLALVNMAVLTRTYHESLNFHGESHAFNLMRKLGFGFFSVLFKNAKMKWRKTVFSRKSRSKFLGCSCGMHCKYTLLFDVLYIEIYTKYELYVESKTYRSKFSWSTCYEELCFIKEKNDEIYKDRND